VLWHCWLGGRKGIWPIKNMGGWWRWAMVSPDGVAPSWMVSVSASVNLHLHHKVQKFSSGAGSPGWSRKRAVKRLWWWWDPPNLQWPLKIHQTNKTSSNSKSTHMTQAKCENNLVIIELVCSSKQTESQARLDQLQSNTHTLYYTVSRKNGTTIFLPLTLPDADNFQNSFTNRLSSKFLGMPL